MNNTIIIVFLMSTVVSALGQDIKSPYSGQESRHIKALSPEDVQGYLAGSGMGFAKAGELNHYPGPKHVLQLAQELQLSQEQIAQTQQIYDDMHQEAVRLGQLYLDKEKELDRLFAEGIVNERELKLLISAIGTLASELRFVHLSAHLKMKQVLSVQQVANYDKLRGYHSSSTHHYKH